MFIGSMLQGHQVLAAGFVVCRFDLDKIFSELVGCLAFDNDSNLSHSTDDHDIGYKSPHHCPAEMMVDLVTIKKTAASFHCSAYHNSLHDSHVCHMCVGVVCVFRCP